MNWLNGCALV